MNLLTEHPALQTLGWTLLHSLWQAALLGLLAWAGLWLLRTRSPGARYTLACGALALMVALPVGTWFVLLPGAAPSLHVVGSAPMGNPGPPTLRETLQPFLPYASVCWAAGVLFMSLRLLGGWVWMQRLRRRRAESAGPSWQRRVGALSRRMGLRVPVHILESWSVDAPMVIGWLKPVILVPAAALAGMEPLALETILIHELEHIRRHDYLVNLLQSVAEALLFYHPAAWWVSRQIRLERENCCDDAAVTLCGDPLLYARALAELETLRSTHELDPRLAVAATGGNLMHRIQRLILPKLPPSSASRAGLLAVLAVSALGAATGLGFQQETPQTPPAQTAPPKDAPAAAPRIETRVIRRHLPGPDKKLEASMEAKAKAIEEKAEALAKRHEATRKTGKTDLETARMEKELGVMARELATQARELAQRELRDVHIPRIIIDGKEVMIPEGEDGLPPGGHFRIEKHLLPPDGPFEEKGDGKEKVFKFIRRGRPDADQEVMQLRAELERLRTRLDRLAPMAPMPPTPPAAPTQPAPPAPPKPPAPPVH
jgi:beta-lactamase regulating signal transducer with metallopeptidase domain